MRAQTVRTIAVHVLLRTAHALALFPLACMVMAFFMHAREASGYPPRWLPSEPSLDQYRTLFSRIDLACDTALMMSVGLDRAPVLVLYAALRG